MSDIETELNAKIDIELKKSKGEKLSGDEKGREAAYREMRDEELTHSILDAVSNLQTIMQLVQKSNYVPPAPIDPTVNIMSTGVVPPAAPIKVFDEDIASLSKELLYEQANALFLMVKALVKKDE